MQPLQFKKITRQKSIDRVLLPVSQKLATRPDGRVYKISTSLSAFDSGDEDGIDINSISLARSDCRSNSRKRP